jgi:hypothetical protein
MVMDTVRIEFMLVNGPGDYVLQNWTTMEGSVQNDPKIYVPRALAMKRTMSATHTARVRVVSEQTDRIVDMFP